MTKPIYIPALLVAVAAAVGSAASLSANTSDGGIFTNEQVQAGELAYASQCAVCHGAELLGPNAPALIGSDVMQNFDTVAGLYHYIATVMPPQAPGNLSDEQYLAIVAYILRKNGASPGTQPLTLDQDRMRQISLSDLTRSGPVPDSGDPQTAVSQEDVPQAFTWGKTLPRVN